MESLQIRLPKDIINKLDELISSGLYRSRSQILQQAIQKFIQESCYNGSLPFIVGPFKDEEYLDKINLPLGSLEVKDKDLEQIRKDLKSFNIKGMKNL